MLIDEMLPETEFAAAVHTIVEADPQRTFDAITTAELGNDALTRVMSEVRELPNRLSAWSKGKRHESVPDSFTFGDLGETDEWVTLGQVAGKEHVAGAIGQFWKKDYGWATPEVSEFVAFDLPGYVKTVAGFSVDPHGEGRSLLTMESRTAATDDEARCRFNTYWRFMRPFATLMMRRGVRAIKAHAERETATATA